MNDIHQKAKRGIKLLLGRQVAAQILTFAGGVVLARILGPSQFGLYVIACFLVNTLALLGDFGLALSLVQRKAELTDLDLQVGFTLQQILTTAVVIGLLITAPWLVAFYPKAPAQTIWLIRAMAFTLYLTSWRSMSVLQLERHLRYERLAKIEVAEIFTFQGLAVILAIAGCGVWSYVFATLAQGILGTILVYTASPWPVRLAFDRKIAGTILRYGIPFQVQVILNSVGGWITPLLVGGMTGPIGVGYLTWASSIGKKPQFIVSSVMRVSFPHFARLQDDRPEVERTIIRYLTLILLPAGLWFSVLLVAGPALVHMIYTTKWTPAVPALILFAAGHMFEMASMIIGMTLNGLGLVSFTTRFVLIRSLLNVAISVALIPFFGWTGVAVGYLASVLITTPWMLYGLGKEAFVKILAAISWQFIPIGVSIAVGESVARIPLSVPVQAVACTVIATTSYIAASYVASPGWLKELLLERLSRRTNLPFRGSIPDATGGN